MEHTKILNNRANNHNKKRSEGNSPLLRKKKKYVISMYNKKKESMSIWISVRQISNNSVPQKYIKQKCKRNLSQRSHLFKKGCDIKKKVHKCVFSTSASHWEDVRTLFVFVKNRVPLLLNVGVYVYTYLFMFVFIYVCMSFLLYVFNCLS